MTCTPTIRTIIRYFAQETFRDNINMVLNAQEARHENDYAFWMWKSPLWDRLRSSSTVHAGIAGGTWI